MKVCIIHDWLVSYRGGEKVLQEILDLYPTAPIYTLFFDQTKLPSLFSKRDIRVPFSSFMHRILRTIPRMFLLPFMPVWIESLNLSEFDLVISTSSCVAKGVVVRPDAVHVSYIHSPMRYVWDQQHEYFKSLLKIPFVAFAINQTATILRMWDYTSSQRPTALIANSSFVKKRLMSYYRRESQVLFPPIDTEFFSPLSGQGAKGDYFLLAGAFVPYKRFDLAIEVCNDLDLPLIIAGQGSEEAKLRSKAGGQVKNSQAGMVKFEIAPTDERLRELLRGAKALIFPGVEDFGMLAIEAMACGTPVVALKRGGACDFIIEGETGFFFTEPTKKSLSEVIKKAQDFTWDQNKLRTFALNFSKSAFREAFRKIVEDQLRSIQ